MEEMRQQSEAGNPEPSDTVIRVREIATDHIWKWLSAGWQDMLKAPGPSLFFGINLALLSFAVTLAVVLNAAYFLLPLLLTGFLLVAPFLGIGPYSVSQQIEKTGSASLKNALTCCTRNTFHTFNMGVILVLCFLAWAMVANLIFVFFHDGLTPSTWQGFVSMLFGSWSGAQILVTGTYAGGLIALAVFAISAVSVPMLMDRPVNVFEAIQTSWTATRRNALPMLLWAGVLSSIMLMGLLTLYLGLIIGFPLAAHATWHAYRDLVP
jgi:uncharacterized membrane protein